MEGVAGGEGGVDVAEDGGEAQQLHLRRPQRHEDGHGVIDSRVGVDDELLLRRRHRLHGGGGGGDGWGIREGMDNTGWDRVNSTGGGKAV